MVGYNDVALPRTVTHISDIHHAHLSTYIYLSFRALDVGDELSCEAQRRE